MTDENRKEIILEEIKAMRERYEQLPMHAQFSSATQSDIYGILLLLESIAKL